jgi:DNA-directed RNA polymerase specialized sigma24 family protein
MTAGRDGDAARVAAALEALPRDVRRAVVLAYYRTLTIPDLSHVLATDTPDVHRDLHDAVHVLASALRSESEPIPASD